MKSSSGLLPPNASVFCLEKGIYSLVLRSSCYPCYTYVTCSLSIEPAVLFCVCSGGDCRTQSCLTLCSWSPAFLQPYLAGDGPKSLANLGAAQRCATESFYKCMFVDGEVSSRFLLDSYLKFTPKGLWARLRKAQYTLRSSRHVSKHSNS